MAKYVMTWRPHAGASAADNEASVKRSLSVFANWSPPADTTFHEFVTRTDGQGGFAVVSADDVTAITREVAKFTPYNEFHVIPVHDIMDGIGLVSEAIAFRDGIS